MTLADTSSTDLFSPTRLGPLELANRIVMAPLTRSRALERDVPSELAIEYYVQRASAGLIIAEATQVSAQGKGYVFTPGIYSDEQVVAWKKITSPYMRPAARSICNSGTSAAFRIPRCSRTAPCRSHRRRSSRKVRRTPRKGSCPW